MSNLTIRILSAFTLLIGGFAAAALNLHTRWALITFMLCAGAWELSRLASRKLASPSVAWLAALTVFALCAARFPGWHPPLLWNWIVVVVALCLLVCVAFNRVSVTVIAPTVWINGFIVVYLGFWGAKVFDLMLPFTGWIGIAPFTFTLFCIAAADTGAYFTGRALGKRKLAPSISSGKTVEGAIGGALSALILAGGMSRAVGLRLFPALVLGLALALASIAGDLVISAFKRWAGAKDTSALIPGHGGIMDRFDALIFAAPIAWLGFQLLG